MIRIAGLVAIVAELDERELQRWIDRGWVRPAEHDTDGWLFAEIDVARTRLIQDLRRRLAVQEDALDLVLGLLDQVYDLRRTLRGVATALASQPEPVRESVSRVLRNMGAD